MKILASTIIWSGLWAAGMFLSAGWKEKKDEVWLILTPLLLAVAQAVWEMTIARGGTQTLACMILGFCLGAVASVAG